MATTQRRKVTTQKERQEVQIKNFLEDRVRSPYQHTPVFNPVELCTCDSSDAMICAQCRPILSRYADPFKTMVHQGTALKKQKRTNPTLSALIPFHTGTLSNKMIGCSLHYGELLVLLCLYLRCSWYIEEKTSSSKANQAATITASYSGDV